MKALRPKRCNTVGAGLSAVLKMYLYLLVDNGIIYVTLTVTLTLTLIRRALCTT
jgi:hypothetical protein